MVGNINGLTYSCVKYKVGFVIFLMATISYVCFSAPRHIHIKQFKVYVAYEYFVAYHSGSGTFPTRQNLTQKSRWLLQLRNI